MSGYTEIAEARDGSPVPLAGRLALHSRYAPAREASQFADSLKEGAFFVVPGLAGGYHIKALLDRFPTARVVAFERTDGEIALLSKIPAVAELLRDKRVKAATERTLRETLKSAYRPAIDGNLTVAPLRSWAAAFPEARAAAERETEAALADIRADFSVQGHFGAVWQRNIMLNLRAASTLPRRRREIDTSLTAAVVAAGPSLDETAGKIERERGGYFVVATDTALSALASRGIAADAAVSVDGQAVSRAHFMHRLDPGTLFVLDLCANPSAARRAISSGADVMFAETGHPLARYANAFGTDGGGESPFLGLTAGSGTVTVAAAAFAAAAGFRRIELFGADFSYSGKPYARGTYLDTQFALAEGRLSPRETAFDALMFRTELKAAEGGRTTTDVLESYGRSLGEFMRSAGFREEPADGTRLFTAAANPRRLGTAAAFDFASFARFYRGRLKGIDLSADSDELRTLLPLAAWAAAHGRGGGALNLAHEKTLGYTGAS